MKRLLLITTAIILLHSNLKAQTCETYAVQDNGSNYEWGLFNPSTGNVTGVTAIATPMSDLDDPNSCIDGQNEMVYFFEVTEVMGNGVFSIVSLNVNTGVNSKQTTTDGGFLEYSNSTGKLHVVQYDLLNNYQIGELTPTTGAVSNIMTTTTQVGSVVGKSTLNEQSGNIYLVEENGLAYTLISINISTGSISSLSITNMPSGGEVWYIEHDNATGKTYVILTDPTSWKIAELNTTTGALSNINTFSAVASPPANTSYMDELNGIFYFGVSGSVVGVDVNTNIGTVQSVLSDIYILEHNNFPCSVGIEENSFGNDLSFFPNPTDGNFSIDLGGKYQTITITMTDLVGKIIQTKTYNESQLLNLSIEESAGIYLLVIESKDKKAVIKLIKE
ncbi:MAG: hypothetical protein COB15_15175 [Flavobacteriales bacterium]|nr:MAG: hypothetical protein COB15_15175 [Flavobacteriales bacterium]